MNCNDVQQYLVVRGELSWVHEQEIQAHLRECTACNTRWQAISRTRQNLRSLPTPDAQPKAQALSAIRRSLRQRSAPSRLRLGMVGGVFISLTFMGVLLLMLWFVQPKQATVHPVAPNDIEPVAGVAPTSEQPGNPLNDVMTVLVLGRDEGGRTDSVLLAHFDHRNEHVAVLSLPRSLWVPYPNGDSGRLGEAYLVGDDQGGVFAKTTVSNLLDTTVDYFILVDFATFEQVVDLVGGVTIDVPAVIDDPLYPTSDDLNTGVYFDAGPQHMDGKRALMYVRTRRADDEFQRNLRQQQVIKALFEPLQRQSWHQQLILVSNSIDLFKDQVQTDMPHDVMLKLGQAGLRLQSDELRFHTVDTTMLVALEPPATFALKPEAQDALMQHFP